MGPFVKKVVFVCVKPCVKYCVYTRRAKMGVPPEKKPEAVPDKLTKRDPKQRKADQSLPFF